MEGEKKENVASGGEIPEMDSDLEESLQTASCDQINKP